MIAITRPLRPTLPIAPRSIAIGLLGAAALLGLYLGIISLAQGAEHALEQLATDAQFVGLIALGFGTQIALFVELRAVDRRHRAATGPQPPSRPPAPEQVRPRCSPVALTTSSTFCRSSGCRLLPSS